MHVVYHKLLQYNTAFQFNPAPIQNNNEEVVHPRTRPSYQDREQPASKTKKTTQTETTRVASDTDNDNDTTLKLMPPKQQRNSVRTSPLLSPSTSHTAPTTAAAATTMLHSPSSVATMRTSNHHNSFNFNTPTSQGQKFSGTPDILISSHVREGPGRIMNAPVPSVFVSSIYIYREREREREIQSFPYSYLVCITVLLADLTIIILPSWI